MDLPMTEAAKAEWVAFYDDHSQREIAEDGPLRSAMSKLEAATARIALVIQLATDPQSVEVGVEAMKAGISISEWFEGQARQVYQGFTESEEERDRRAACDWIRGRGGHITKRDFERLGPNRFRSRPAEVLADLVDVGLAKRSPKTGHRAQEYVLCDCDSCDGGTERGERSQP